MKKYGFVAPVVKTTLAGAAMVFLAGSLLGSGELARQGNTDTSPDAKSKPAVPADGVRRISVKGAVMRDKRSGEIDVNAVALDDPIAVDDPANLGRVPFAIARRSTGASGTGGIAGGSVCPNPDPDANCDEAHGGVGCNDEDCCLLVCGEDPECCNPDGSGWDAVCASTAEMLCVVEPDCSDFTSPGAIYSNWAPPCATGFSTSHGTLLRADDLWYGDNGGLLQQLTFSVSNAGASNDTLLGATLEIIISSTAPGFGYAANEGFLDLSTVIAIIEVELDEEDLGDGLASGTSAIFTLPDLADENIMLPPPMVYAGIRFVEAEFEQGLGTVANLGQRLVSPPALGASANSMFMEGFSASAGFTGGNPPARLAWELVADGDFGPTRILWDPAPQQGLNFNNVPFNNVGLGSGPSTTQPHNWSAVPFTLPDVPEGGDAWRITGIFAHGFIAAASAPNIETLDWIIWSRDGLTPPADGDQVASGSVPYPQLHMSQGMNNIGARIHPIPIDVVLAPGDYFMTVFGNGAVAPAQITWFFNAEHGINILNANGQPVVLRVANFPSAWSMSHFATLLPNPEQENPDTTHTHHFFVMGEPTSDVPDPTGACNISNCPADLTGNNNVGVPDLLALLAAWGPCPAPCAADLTGNGNVGVPDLLALLAAWGPCPAPTCQVLTAGDCAAAGGAYQGDGSSCP